MLDNRINSDALHQQDQKSCSKKCKKMQSEITAKLLDPKLSGALLNSVYFSFKKEGRVTAVVAQARYHKVTQNQTKKRFEHSARSHPCNEVIKVLLDSGPDGD